MITPAKPVLPRIAWLGDDFTGTAAVAEVLTFAGIPSVIFTAIPDAALAARFEGASGIGLATTARSHVPAWMDRELPPLLRWLIAQKPDLLHYKICTTFDSAPEVGSIGRAMEIALALRPVPLVPLVTAAPAMRRYQVFGHLFASAGEQVCRIDRHPVMARHPVTPMAESDLLAHLSRQTDLPGALLDIEGLARDPDAAISGARRQGARVLSIDMMDARSEAASGRVLWDHRAEMNLVFGSQGVEYALVRHWREAGLLPPAPVTGSAGVVDRIVVVSGSVSLVTAQQIASARQHGFAPVAFDAAAVCTADGARATEESRVVRLSCEAAAQGQSPLVHSAAGPDDPATQRFRAALSASRLAPDAAQRRIGESLGRVLDAVLRSTGIRRAVISGGDTSGHGMRQLGLGALQAIAPTIPGAALCRAHGAGPHDGLEIALKGGQMGSDDYFSWIRAGGGPR